MELASDLEQVVGKPTPALPHLFFCYPFTRPHYDDFLRSAVNLAAHGGGFGAMDFHSIFGFSTDAGRNALAQTFLQTDADFMLMVDNDCLFAPEGVERLLSHNKPIVCGAMYTRALPPKPTAGTYLGMDEGGKHIYKFVDITKMIIRKARRHVTDLNALRNDVVFPAEEGDLIAIDGCGMHFTLIRRDVIEAMQPPYFAFQYNVFGGEDFYFCRKAKELGFDIFIDISVHTGHIDSEDHNYGLKETLLLTQYLTQDDYFEVGSWEV